MIVPLESVRLKEAIDTHDQRNHLVLDAAHGWDLALDEDHRFILVQHKGTWRAEFPVEHARHWVRAAVEDPGQSFPWTAAQERGQMSAKGKKR
jgi:hypothetical protein